MRNLHTLAKKKHVIGIEGVKFKKYHLCGACEAGKMTRAGRVAISRDQHMDKVMLVESLGFNLMSVSMLCDLNMIVIFGKYRCLVLMESDKSLVFEGYRKEDLYMVDFSAGPHLAVCLLAKLQSAGSGIGG